MLSSNVEVAILDDKLIMIRRTFCSKEIFSTIYQVYHINEATQDDNNGNNL
jgi:hypothetical protein